MVVHHDEIDRPELDSDDEEADNDNRHDENEGENDNYEEQHEEVVDVFAERQVTISASTMQGLLLHSANIFQTYDNIRLQATSPLYDGYIKKQMFECPMKSIHGWMILSRGTRKSLQIRRRRASCPLKKESLRYRFEATVMCAL